MAGGIIKLTWNAPAAGPAPTGYLITTSPGAVSLPTTGTSATVSPANGLIIGNQYTFNVTSTNASGNGGTAMSLPITVGDVPGAPAVTANPTRGVQETLTWAAAAPHGYPVTGYTITSNPAGVNLSAGGTATSIVINRLTNGTQYTFSVTATNAMGTGMPGTSLPVTAACSVVSRTLTAVDSVTVEYGTAAFDSTSLDLLDAVFQGSRNDDLTGWSKFSMDIPSADWAVITALSLRLDLLGTTGTGTSAPVLEIHYTTSDGWAHTVAQTAASIPRTVVVSNTAAPGTVNAYQIFPILISAHDFTGDLVAGDRFITLGVTNVTHSNTLSEGFYAPADAAGQAPLLVVSTCE
jgi:hypothetical protein